jgi:hypothetical protein
MSAIHGKNTYFMWNSVDLSPYLNDFSFPREADTAETSTFGATYKTYVVGLIDASISGSGVWDGAAGGPDATLAAGLATSAAFEFRANSAAVGVSNPKYTGTAILTKYEITGSIGDAVAFSAEWQLSSTVTRATS